MRVKGKLRKKKMMRTILTIVGASIGLIAVVFVVLIIKAMNNQKGDSPLLKFEHLEINVDSFNNLSEERLISALNSVDVISDVEAASIDNDPNGLLEDGACASYAYFKSSLVSDPETSWLNPVDAGNGAGGCVEIYKTEEDAKNRLKHLDKRVSKRNNVGGHGIIGKVVFRTSHIISADMQQKLAENVVLAISNLSEPTNTVVEIENKDSNTKDALFDNGEAETTNQAVKESLFGDSDKVSESLAGDATSESAETLAKEENSGKAENESGNSEKIVKENSEPKGSEMAVSNEAQDRFVEIVRADLDTNQVGTPHEFYIQKNGTPAIVFYEDGIAMLVKSAIQPYRLLSYSSMGAGYAQRVINFANSCGLTYTDAVVIYKDRDTKGIVFIIHLNGQVMDSNGTQLYP